MSTIEFGTDGWRGVIAKDYTFDNLGRVAKATADYLNSSSRKDSSIYSEWGTTYRPAKDGVIIGYDARFMSEEFALFVAKILKQNGIPAFVSSKAVPTPAVSLAVRDEGLAGGIMITASHNPPEYNGFKFKCEFAASAPPEITDQIENHLPESPPEVDEKVQIDRKDISEGYIEALTNIVDGNRLKDAPILAVVDSMYGSAKGYAAKILDKFDIPCVQVRNEDNPGFKGIRPEPLEEYLDPLKEEVVRQSKKTDRLVVGIVTDGDGDRISGVAEDGSFIDAHRTYALLIKYLAEVKNWDGKVVKNFPLTDMVFKLGEKYNLPVEETPVGFKYIAEKMIREDVLIGGEESGGIGIKNHIPERDGVLCGLSILELVAEEEKPMSAIITEIMDDIGYHYYHRNDIHLDARKDVVEKIDDNPPEKIAGYKIKKIERTDGVKLRFDNGWLLMRASGTEPVLRIYCEMNSMEKVKNVLQEAEKYAKKLAGV